MTGNSNGQPAAEEDFKAEDWAGDMGARWLAHLASFENTIAPVGDTLLAHAGYCAGEAVIDLGCGGGATSLAIAHAVTPGGKVLGIDISPDLVAATIHRAAQAGITNARFICADAANVEIAGKRYDRLFSRFGSMFFANPVAAFANLRGLLKSGGRIDLAVWAAPQDNPWMTDAMLVARNYTEMPAPAPRAPGPFAFQDTDYLEQVLSGAGLSHISIEPRSGLLPVGGSGSTPAIAQQFAMNAMAFGKLLAECPPAVQGQAAMELTELYARHHQPGTGVMMAYKVWLVSAQA